MNVCVAGWYWNDQFLSVLNEVSKKHFVYIVAHNEPKKAIYVTYKTIQNIGLEFGCYNYFLMNTWIDGNTLFVHDDTTVSGPEVFDRISEISHDCAYIFRDRFEEEANGGKHGRAFFCSKRFMRYLKDNGGFWYDKENFGYTGAKGQQRPVRRNGKPINFNEGINRFHKMLGIIRNNNELEFDVVNRVYSQDFEAGRRGTWRHKLREWTRYGKLKRA